MTTVTQVVERLTEDHVEYPELVVTAAAEVHTGAMIALLPSRPDAAIMELTDAYAEPADQLHVTLLYLGEAAGWSAYYRQLLNDVVAEIVSHYTSIETSTFSVNVFNPGDDEFDTAIVLGVRGTDLLVALHKAITEDITDVFDDEVPEQHNPWVPHITLAYTDEVAEVLPEATEKLGPVTFDRVGVFFGGEVTEYSLDGVLTAAGKKQWKEGEHPRDTEGKFAKTPSIEGILSFLKDETDELPFDFTEKGKTPRLDLDAVPPATAIEGDKTKYTDPAGVPGLLTLADDPGKSGDGWTTKADGKPGPWGRYGAAGVLLRHRGEDGVDRYLLVKRGKALDHAGKWQLPGGGLDSKETPLQGAAREIVEELGFSAEDVAKGRVHGFHEVSVPLKNGKDWKYTSIAATVPDQLVPDLSGENAQLETAEAKWLTLDEIQAMDDDGKLLGPLAGGKWKQNMVDLFPAEPTKPSPAPVVKTAADDVTAGDFSKLKRVGAQKGTNPGGVFEAPDGSRWYVKAQKDEAHAENERVASALYREAGIAVPEVHVGSGVAELGSGPQTATRIVEGVKSDLPKRLTDEAYLAKIREGFAMDALLGNYDTVGLVLDNIVSDPNGDPIRIDVGGALEFRAQGKAKGALFGTSVTDWDELRTGGKSVLAPSQKSATRVFGGITPEQLTTSVEHVEALTPEKIHEIVKDKKLADKLVARREDLLKRAEAEGVLSSVTADVDFHPVQDHGAETIQSSDLTTSPVVITPITKGGPSVTKDAVWWDVQAGNHGEVGDIIATGTKNGVNYRLVVAKKGNGETYIVEQLENSPDSWVMYAGFPTETSFKNASLSKYGISNTPKIVDVDDRADVDVPSPTDAFKQHMASKVPTPESTELKVSGVEHDLSIYKQENIWYAALMDMELDEGDVILKGTTLDVHNNPLRIVVRKDDQGFVKLHEEEFDQQTGTWIKGRTWNNEAEFNDASLDEYDVVKGAGKYSASTGTVTPVDAGLNLSNGVIPVDSIHPGPFSTTGAPHAKLWNQVGKGQYASGHAVAGGVNPKDGSYHHLVAHQYGSGQWALHDEFEDPPDSGDFYPLGTYKSLTDFAESDFSYMGIGKPMMPPGPVKAVTTPASVPSVAPKKVPKLTNAIIYGKYQNGEVIATAGDGSWRVVYQDNKIQIQAKSVDDTWKGKGYGKAEAYKKLQGLDTGSGWFLGELVPSPAKVPIEVTPMTEVTVPTVSPTKLSTSHLDLTETIKQGQYQNGDIVATYVKPGSSTQTRVIFTGGIFIKETRPSGSSSWSPSTHYGTSDLLLTSMAKGSGTWTKADEPSGGLKPGAKPPAELTPKIAASFKKTFDDQGVKWHTNADLMLKALSDALKEHPDFTSAQVLAHMDTTTKTKTSPTPFTDKVTKYLKTKNGVAAAKSLGLPVGKVKTTPSYKAPKAPTPGPAHVGPTVFIHDEPHVGPTAAPGTYKVQGVSGMNVIHDQMMAQHGSWTSTQISAIKSYTGTGYGAMNGCLRKPVTCSPAVQKKNADLQSAMRPTTAPFQVTRGAGWSATGISGCGGASDKKCVAELQKLEGKVLQEPGFLSTSAASTPAFSVNPVKFVIDVPVGTPGAWVYKVSVHKSEEEFLLAAGLKYRVKKIIPSPGYLQPSTVHLEVIPS